MQKFVHLHNHSHYSILEAICTPKELIEKALEDNQTTLALTDSAVMFGSLEFYKSCNAKGLKPIIGMRANVANGSRFDRGAELRNKKKHFHLVLLAKNITGYKNLMKLSSLGSMEGFYYVPRIDKELLEKYGGGLIALSGGFGGDLAYYLMNEDFETARENAQYYKNLFGKDYYIELQNHKIDYSNDLVEAHVKIARELDIPIVATNNTHYMKQKHAIAHNIHLLIKNTSTGDKVDYENLIFRSDEFYFKTQEQMIELFKDYPDAIENTIKIAEQCNIELDLKTNHMPSFPIPDTSKATDLDEYLRELVYEGLYNRFDQLSDEITERADFELKIIKDMGFPGYFLIVWDFIKASRKIGVSVGPGRGSAAGSLVAYALEITNVDPLKYDLLFERFLNPERVSMPDIDIDFNDEKRDMAIDYTKKKYGEEAVSQIITFGKLTTKAVLTDVGRVLQVDLSLIKQITKDIPVTFGKVLELSKAVELPDIKEIIDNGDDNLKACIKYALILEGKVRSTGIHAAGVVIAPGELTDYVPIYKPSRDRYQSLEIATQYSMADLEDAGLLKMDFLGLRTLSIIDNTLEMIKENYGDEIDIDKIDIDDKQTYDMISSGDTLAIFQFESDGMQDYLKKLKPRSLEELTAMNALYRPGPMENIPDFIDRKFKRQEITYLHPLMEKSLHNTNGIIVYQEQVMMLVQDIAGFSLGEADVLRRAMGKKVLSIMDGMKPRFCEGAAVHNISETLALEIFELIYKFANYGFNKSHSLAYSFVAYQTAWLKCHYPAEFLAANMTAELGDQKKIATLRENAKKKEIKLLPPDVNKSETKFVARDNKIYFSLAAIKNVGIPAVQSIVDNRKDEPYTTLFDFISKVDTRLINKRSLEALIFTGAFDSLNTGHRNSLFMSADNAFDYAKAMEEQSAMNMDSLFMSDDGGSSLPPPKLLDAKVWTETERLDKEKEYLDFYVSGHPLFKYVAHIKSFSKNAVINAEGSKITTKSVRFCGLVSEIRTRINKSGKTFAFVKVEDFFGKIECIFWANSYEECKDDLILDSFVMIEGKPQSDDDKLKIVASRVYSSDEMIKLFAKGYKIWLDIADDKTLDRVKKFDTELCIEQEKTDLLFQVFDKEKQIGGKYQARQVNLELCDANTAKLMDLFGDDNIRFLK